MNGDYTRMRLCSKLQLLRSGIVNWIYTKVEILVASFYLFRPRVISRAQVCARSPEGTFALRMNNPANHLQETFIVSTRYLEKPGTDSRMREIEKTIVDMCRYAKYCGND